MAAAPVFPGKAESTNAARGSGRFWRVAQNSLSWIPDQLAYVVKMTREWSDGMKDERLISEQFRVLSLCAMNESQPSVNAIV